MGRFPSEIEAKILLMACTTVISYREFQLNLQCVFCVHDVDSRVYCARVFAMCVDHLATALWDVGTINVVEINPARSTGPPCLEYDFDELGCLVTNGMDRKVRGSKWSRGLDLAASRACLLSAAQNLSVQCMYWEPKPHWRVSFDKRKTHVVPKWKF